MTMNNIKIVTELGSSETKFVEIIDHLVPDSLKTQLLSEVEDLYKNMEQYDTATGLEGFAEFLSMAEKYRNMVIKKLISSTHEWVKARTTDSNGLSNDILWCQKCDIKASVFQHIKTLAIIEKVKDKLPTYTVHSEYLMYTCDQVRSIASNGNGCNESCMECGINIACRTDKCLEMIPIS